MQYGNAQCEDKTRNKILIFEYITGGGLSQEALPESLAKEGLLMLKALINELAPLSSVQLTILLDGRINDDKLPGNIKIIRVSKEQCVYQLLPVLIDEADFIWPIAPEMGGALQKITQLVEQKSKRLLNSSSQAIAICSDKLLTIQCLKKEDIATAESIQLDEFSQEFAAPWVIKPKDGVGCLNNHLVSNRHEFIKIKSQIECQPDYLVQSYIKGVSLSLSCLFKEGEAWLLCCNRQVVSINKGMFELEACIVNINTENYKIYQDLINHVASVIFGLSGYVGIDIIQPESGQAMILEINPRLTTSYVGINQAIGFNVAKAVIELPEINPIIKKMRNQQITVSIIDI
jgi:predicted ATP-grasp superfamily ATP-dependent carboligase